MKKIEIFLEIAKTLNKHKIIPILYGSLGVSRLIQIKNINDIDIVIPDIWLTKKFEKFKKIMKSIGYYQDSLYPYEFTKGKGQIGFEPKNSLKKYMGIETKNIKITTVEKVKFAELSAEQYLIIYNKTIKLWEKRIEKMEEKIDKLKKTRIPTRLFVKKITK